MSNDGRHLLNRHVHKVEQRAFDKETSFRLDNYKPNYFATYTFRRHVTEARAIEEIKRFLVSLANSVKSHVYWFGWYDTQPNRGLDGRTYTHFHLFIEVEKLNSVKQAFVEILLNNWALGNGDVRRYVDSAGAIKYSISKHAGYVEGISCPRVKHACNKRGRVCAYIWKDGLFKNRHRQR